MGDSLLTAAQRLGIAIEHSAGPGGLPSAEIWSCWPRHRLEVAHEVLDRVMALRTNVGVVPVGPEDRWCSYAEAWNFTGGFEEAVAALAMNVLARPGHHSGARSSSPGG